MSHRSWHQCRVHGRNGSSEHWPTKKTCGATSGTLIVEAVRRWWFGNGNHLRRWCTRVLVYSRTYSPTRLLAYSLTCVLAYSRTCVLAYSLTRLLTHSLTRVSWQSVGWRGLKAACEGTVDATTAVAVPGPLACMVTSSVPLPLAFSIGWHVPTAVLSNRRRDARAIACLGSRWAGVV